MKLHLWWNPGQVSYHFHHSLIHTGCASYLTSIFIVSTLQSLLQSFGSTVWFVSFTFRLHCPHQSASQNKKKKNLIISLTLIIRWLEAWISTCDLQPVTGGRLDSRQTSCSTTGTKASDSGVLVWEAVRKDPFYQWTQACMHLQHLYPLDIIRTVGLNFNLHFSSRPLWLEFCASEYIYIHWYTEI